MDISTTVEPRSDQLNFDDVAAAPMTITINAVKAGGPEQPVELHNDEHPGRPYKPGKSMRRVLIAAWGREASEYVGRRITIYGDPSIRFGKDAVGGIRISHLSHLEKPVTVALTVTRGKRAPFKVEPLTTPQKASQGQVDAALTATRKATTVTDLDKIWDRAKQLNIHTELADAIDTRRTELEASA